MGRIAFGPADKGRLRFVFGDRVLSLGVVADVTFGEIARTLGELSSRRYGSPLAIDVTLANLPAQHRKSELQSSTD